MLVGHLLGRLFNFCAQIWGLGGKAVNAQPATTLQNHVGGVVGELKNLYDFGNNAHPVQVVKAGVFGAAVFLAYHTDGSLVLLSLVYEIQRFLSTDGHRHCDIWKQHNVAKCQDWHVGEVDFAVGRIVVVVNPYFGDNVPNALRVVWVGVKIFEVVYHN